MIEKSCTLSMNGSPTRIRKRNQFSQSRWSFTKVMPMEKTYTGYKRGSKCCTNSPTYPFLRHIWCAILLNDIMDLHMSSFGSWCVFYATRRQVCWGLTHNVVFCWYSNLISHTQTHTHTNTHTHTHTHTCKDTQYTHGASRLTHPHKYIFIQPAICS